MDIDYKAIGARIRSKRKKLGMTQQQLAEAADLSDTNISHIERGATKLSLPSLIAVSNALGATADELLTDNVTAAELPIKNELAQITADCTKEEYRALSAVCKAVLECLRGK